MLLFFQHAIPTKKRFFRENKKIVFFRKNKHCFFTIHALY